MSPVASDLKSASRRLAFFCCLWLMVAGVNPKDLPIGLIAAVGSLWVSLAVAPPNGDAHRLLPMLKLAGRFLRGSVVAGFDVAFRALAPRMKLTPGFVTYPLGISAGDARNAFCFYQSLQPGLLPTGVEGNGLMIHGLDTTQPVLTNIARDEALFEEATNT
jgi:multicomponent Na+:H+ antiporter subunit E